MRRERLPNQALPADDELGRSAPSLLAAERQGREPDIGSAGLG